MKPLFFKDQLSLRHDVFNLDVSLSSYLTSVLNRFYAYNTIQNPR